MVQETHAENPKKVKSEAWEWIKALVIALVLVLLIRSFLFAPFIVSGPSMQPNFYDGERLIVNKILYKFRAPERGEVIVFHATEDRDYIKRVIALPGEKVKVEGDKVYVNGKLLAEPYIQEEVNEAAKRGTTYNNRDFAEQTVPAGTVFVMGDNRPNSEDSRSIGFISFDRIVGRTDLIFWPLSKIELVRH